MWLQQLLVELGIKLTNPPNIFSYDIGAKYLCANLVFYSRMKHLSIDYNFVRDIIAKGDFKVPHVPSSHQLADLLSLPLSRSRHEFLVSKIDVLNHSSILRGRISISSVAPWFQLHPFIPTSGVDSNII